MHVKDYIQALTDEGQIRVEKIGSGNWYWSFVSDTKKTKEFTISSLQAEEDKVKATLMGIDASIEDEIVQREYDEELLDDGGMDRKTLLDVHALLLEENDRLDKELAGHSNNDPTEVLRKVKETKELKEGAERWTDNTEAIEAFMTRQTGNRDEVRRIMQQICEDDYIPGEGLKDL